MRIFERLRERQTQRLIEPEAEVDVAPAGAGMLHDGAVDFQPAEAVRHGYRSAPPQAANSPA